jgi:hydrogenase maturation protease
MAREASLPPKTMILGIGNLLWGDEAWGVRALEAFHEAYEVPDDVTLLDGGTQGLYLVNMLDGIERLLIFDAIDYGLEPGTLKLVRDAEVPKFTGAKKMSLHQTGFQEVLSAAELLGYCPPTIALIGCQPEDLEDWGGPLKAPVVEAMPSALRVAEAVLAEWGIRARPRLTPLAPAEALLGNDLERLRYEAPGGLQAR